MGIIPKQIKPNENIEMQIRIMDSARICSHFFELFPFMTVNHTLHFRDPQTGVHTNTIEGSWNGVKRSCPVRCRGENDVEKDLFEFIWRRRQRINHWIGFINGLRKVHYI